MSVQSKRIEIQTHGEPSVMEWVDTVVEAPASDEVQIEQKAVGLNFIDIYFRTGLYANPLPHGLGFEGSGVVTAVGSEVSHLKVGDRVAYGQSPIGAYALVRNVPAFQVVKLPDGISFEEAAAINCHMGPDGKDFSCMDVYRESPLAFFLHTADMASTVFDEPDYIEEYKESAS